MIDFIDFEDAIRHLRSAKNQLETQTLWVQDEYSTLDPDNGTPCFCAAGALLFDFGVDRLDLDSSYVDEADFAEKLAFGTLAYCCALVLQDCDKLTSACVALLEHGWESVSSHTQLDCIAYLNDHAGKTATLKAFDVAIETLESSKPPETRAAVLALPRETPP